ncbi:MAG: hypothetical protein LBK52_07760 [Deltaproteobacteria bacterium]|jgi:hypothetical protein|nr:hypothetical protein [Deltaproteobacteria bacterium]
MTGSALQPRSQSVQEGMILLTALVLVLIMTIAGGVLLYKNRSELATTTNYRNHQKALANADMVMKVTMKALDVFISTANISEVREAFKYNSAEFGYTLDFSSSFNELIENMGQEKRMSIKSRYLGAGSTGGGNTPDVIVRDNQNRIIGMARISFDFIDRTVEYGGQNQAGLSMQYSGIPEGVNSVTSYFIITVIGRDPEAGDGDLYAADAAVSAGPQAFLTALYCTGLSCEKG